MKYTGSCLCGEIVFEIDGDFENFFLCHCAHCRKDTGSAHAANLFSSTAKLRWLSGKDKVKIFNYKSSGHIKSFCSDCGSALPNIQMEGTLLVVPAGCLDSEVSIKPQGHIYMASKANWDNDLDKVPKFNQLPPTSKGE
ncbi:GFA family protein [Wukongibacter sp. M2B1]|uniref:GFA family protein n=1 Tax=Wukongibacter sp. M2B1 TaxID=3088895 RepID=UPI003D7B3275